MIFKETTLVKSLFCHINAEHPQNASALAIKTFGNNSAVAKLLAQKGFTNPSQDDYASISASQQFLNLIESVSLIGQLKSLAKHIEMPLNTLVSSFDLSDCEVVAQSEPTTLLNEKSQIGFTLDSKKIGGFAIFPDRYFKEEMFSKVEPMINMALANSYAAGENTAFINALKADATESVDLETALKSIVDVKNAIIIMNPHDAIELAKTTTSDKLGVNGGVYFDVPVITNKSMGVGEKIIFDLSKLVLAQDSFIKISNTDESVVTTLTGELVLLFQENKKAIKIIGETGYSLMTGYTATLVKG